MAGVEDEMVECRRRILILLVFARMRHEKGSKVQGDVLHLSLIPYCRLAQSDLSLLFLCLTNPFLQSPSVEYITKSVKQREKYNQMKFCVLLVFAIKLHFSGNKTKTHHLWISLDRQMRRGTVAERAGLLRL